MGLCLCFDFPGKINLPKSVDWLPPRLGPQMAFQKLTNGGCWRQLKHLDER
ncbi:hypothetical protein AM571_PA00107 (plasmid) [Rhizobium etli 8C-3]|uniref:Uncharacterized protein n=1 Tax=Rhizobium etli 8C-3 TaxID=538025 RepID=A0A1L5PA62_RHIET|nr:hypothetical protein AM571_PA00107 [Rhizobium etli 8C-3]